MHAGHIAFPILTVERERTSTNSGVVRAWRGGTRREHTANQGIEFLNFVDGSPTTLLETAFYGCPYTYAPTCMRISKYGCADEVSSSILKLWVRVFVGVPVWLASENVLFESGNRNVVGQVFALHQHHRNGRFELRDR